MDSLNVLTGLSILAVGASVAWAQNVDAIDKRRAAMRAIAQAGSQPFQMFTNKADFDLAKVQAGLKAYQDEGAKLAALFPPDSKTGGGTDATAKIWTARAEFDKGIENFLTTAKAAAAAIKDEASFRVEYKKVTETCGSCHGDQGGFAPKTADSFKKMREELEKQKK